MKSNERLPSPVRPDFWQRIYLDCPSEKAQEIADILEKGIKSGEIASYNLAFLNALRWKALDYKKELRRADAMEWQLE